MGNNIFQSIPFLRQLEKLKNVGLIHISIYDSWGRVHSILGKLGNFSRKLHDSKHLKVNFLVSFESYVVSRWNSEKYCCYSMGNFVNSFLVQFGWCQQKNFLLPVTQVWHQLPLYKIKTSCQALCEFGYFSTTLIWFSINNCKWPDLFITFSWNHIKIWD